MINLNSSSAIKSTIFQFWPRTAFLLSAIPVIPSFHSRHLPQLQTPPFHTTSSILSLLTLSDPSHYHPPPGHTLDLQQVQTWTFPKEVIFRLRTEREEQWPVVIECCGILVYPTLGTAAGKALKVAAFYPVIWQVKCQFARFANSIWSSVDRNVRGKETGGI